MIRSLFHILLSAMLVGSSLSLTVNMHFCHDQLYDIAVNHPAHSCCDVDAEPSRCHHDQAVMDKHHCNDESLSLRTTDDYFASGFQFDFRDFHSFDLFLTDPVSRLTPVTDAPEFYSIIDYKKPPPQAVVLSQIQSFLI